MVCAPLTAGWLLTAAAPAHAMEIAVEMESQVPEARSGAKSIEILSDAAASGGSAVKLSASGAAPEARLGYIVDFPESGTWYVWLQGRSGEIQLNPVSIEISFDDQKVARIAKGTGFGLTWRWSAQNSTEVPVAKIQVDKEGPHELAVSVTDGSVALDRMVLIQDAGTRPGGRVAAPASDLTDSVGVNVHLSYRNTSYGDLGKVQKALEYLGVHHLRDIITKDQRQLDQIDALMAKGYDFNFMIPPDLGSIPEQIARMRPRAGHIASVEGPNEDDLTKSHVYNGKGFPDGTRMMQGDLYGQVKADPDLGRNGKDIPVIAPSLGRGASYGQLGDLSASVDFGNTHNYFASGAPPGSSWREKIAEAQVVAKGRRMVATEGGYHTAEGISTGNLGLNPETHGKYMMRFLLSQYEFGWERTYIYELLDLDSDPGKSDRAKNWGLFDANGSPKPAARGISAMMALLHDGAAGETSERMGGRKAKGKGRVGVLDYTLTGMPPTGEELLLKKRDGRFYLLLWNEVNNWDERAARALAPAEQSITVSLATAATTVNLYRPLSNGTDAVETHHKVTQIGVGLPDHPVIVEIVPR